MIVLGVTGSIGSGKSFVCKCLAKMRGVKIISSDDEVHKLFASHRPLISEVSKLVPEAVNEYKIDRHILGNKVFSNPELREQLEQLIYPHLAAHRQTIKKLSMRNRDIKILVLDIPLLFEKHLNLECDVTLAVYCRRSIQKQRVLRRNKMTEEKFNKIDGLQIPPSVKKLLADYTINSGLEKAATFQQVKKLYQILVL